MDRSDEPSAFAWIMSGTVTAVVAAGLGKFLLDRRHAQAAQAREEAQAAAAQAGADIDRVAARVDDDAQAAEQAAEQAESEGHPS